MSTENINILAANVKGKCDSKCSYVFKYQSSNSTAKNNNVMINVTYEASSTAPVIFNGQKYVVDNISIVSPSIHVFNYDKLSGEIIVEHSPVQGGNILKVCVPCVSSTDTSTASQIITDIIETVASNAPSEGETTALTSSFSLQDIIPRKPYFMYEENKTDWIVYGVPTAIPLNSSTITTLQQIIFPYSFPTPGENLFYNSAGPVSGVEIGDGIYISCKPTGSTEEETSVTYNTQSTSTSSTISFKSPIVKLIVIIIISCVLLIIIFYGINTFYNYLMADDNPTMSSSYIPKFSNPFQQKKQ